MQRAVYGALAVRVAVKTAVGHMLCKQEIHNRFKIVLRRAKIGGIVQKHAVDADITFLFCPQMGKRRRLAL